MSKANRAIIIFLWVLLIAMIAMFGNYYTAENEFNAAIPL
jgi:uncharacterized BrkB/YihY/UPF0761 family membrane protein